MDISFQERRFYQSFWVQARIEEVSSRHAGNTEAEWHFVVLDSLASLIM